MGALEVIQSNLIQQSKAPVTNSTGGTSKGDPTAGEGGGSGPTNTDPVTLGGKVGAGFMTLFIVVSVVGLFSWMTFEGSGWQYTVLADN
jgi:mannan endo-1,6-alpha-mannosidase